MRGLPLLARAKSSDDLSECATPHARAILRVDRMRCDDKEIASVSWSHN